VFGLVILLMDGFTTGVWVCTELMHGMAFCLPLCVDALLTQLLDIFDSDTTAKLLPSSMVNDCQDI